jgi:hypothetical protein
MPSRPLQQHGQPQPGLQATTLLPQRPFEHEAEAPQQHLDSFSPRPFDFVPPPPSPAADEPIVQPQEGLASTFTWDASQIDLFPSSKTTPASPANPGASSVQRSLAPQTQARGFDLGNVSIYSNGERERAQRSLKADPLAPEPNLFVKQGIYQPQNSIINLFLEDPRATKVLQRRQVCDAEGACWSEAGPDESYYSDGESSSVVGDLTTGDGQQQVDPNKPVFEEYKGQSINQAGYISAPAKEYDIAKTVGVNVRAKPDGTLPNIAKVLYGTKAQVQALDSTGAFYFIIADTGAVGWINKNFVALDPPDPGSRLHHITEGDLTTILKNEYVDKGLWPLSTGNDYTTLAAAVVAANQGRKSVFVDWAKAQEYKEEHPAKRYLDPWMIDNFAIYHGSTILAGHNIWLPSTDYIRMLQSSGVIGSRPDWINTAVDVGNGIAGFFAGVSAGVFGSLWDTLTGLWELGKSIVDTVKGVLDGSLFSAIQSIYDTVTSMTWEDFQKMVSDIITMGQNAFSNFQKQWEHPDTYKKWHFRGYTIGAIALEVVLAIFSGGAALGAKVLAKIGKYFPKLMKVLNKLLKVADKLDFRKKRGKGHKHKDHDRDHDSDRDRKNKDDEDMSNDDRAWEQARLMASMITEQHDLKDTPVAELIPILKATIGAKYKVVKGYQAIPKGAPNTYKIIQLSRKREVDDTYTERTEKGKSFRGGKKKNRDNWYGYNDKSFQRWWHREGKAEFGGDDIEDAEQAKQIYEYWVSIGKPKVK